MTTYWHIYTKNKSYENLTRQNAINKLRSLSNIFPDSKEDK